MHRNTYKNHVQDFQHQQGARIPFNDLCRSNPSFPPVKRRHPSTIPFLVHIANEFENERQPASFAMPAWRKIKKNGPCKKGLLKRKHGCSQKENREHKR